MIDMLAKIDYGATVIGSDLVRKHQDWISFDVSCHRAREPIIKTRRGRRPRERTAIGPDTPVSVPDLVRRGQERLA